MKTCVRIGSLVLALGLAGLLAGCVSDTKTSRRARDFEIVETSTKRTLNAKEMAQLQAMVADYLQKEGETDSGDYYVKVFLTPDKDGVPGEWVVVRYSRPTEYVATHFSAVSSYPDYGYSSYYPRYNLDYYPFGWFGFSAFSLSYYDDPFYYYGYGSAYPRRDYTNYGWQTPNRRHDRDRDRDHDRDRDRDRGDDHHGPLYGNRPPASQPPSDGTPRVIHNRWDNHTSDRNGQPRDNTVADRNDGRSHWRGREDGTGPRTSAPASETTVTPSPAARFKPSAPPITSRVPATNGDGNSGDRQSRMTNSREHNPPGYNRPAREDAADNNRRDYGGRERNYEPRRNSNQESQAATYTPPAPRSDPAPSYNPPASRSEAVSENVSRDRNQDGSHDSGRRARSE